MASHRLLTTLCALGTALLLGWLLTYSAYGIDFTDESFYLVWMANPFIYPGSVTQFGFVYHPLHLLLGGDIAALRQANILITFSLAWVLSSVFLSSQVPALKTNRSAMFIAAAGLASSVFFLFNAWLITPSYNSLALQALLITTTGLILAEKSSQRASIAGWILIGIGGGLAFLAKPSTALALALAVLLYLIFSRKLSLRMLALAVACTLLLLVASALLIDGSVLHFIERLQLGLAFTQYMEGGYSLDQVLRIDKFLPGKKLTVALLLLALET